LAGRIIMPAADIFDIVRFTYGLGKLILWCATIAFAWDAIAKVVDTIRTLLNPEWWAINSLIDEVPDGRTRRPDRARARGRTTRGSGSSARRSIR